ncbi:hypothetical protein SAMN04488544_3752 [Microlunatus sagamiharensis]|uniref:Asp23 family, cell envelope-related function n=1 Tax=Microlunatus sagamiharensis TaxID=546874 RepID=A0A1H2NCK9_9ACTN|nr:hypothetical protein [Microlunatus sagamiharensis]SDV03150.1 hypothetical protein SAMN04488544_3752 [Microlunatus sagamiharensis]
MLEQAESRTGAGPSDAPTDGPRGSASELRARVGSTVSVHRGVFRIEPTLRGSWSGAPGSSVSAGAPLDGIVLHVRERLVDLEVNISTRADHQAHLTVTELRARLAEVVAELGFVCRALTINVLSIEPAR